MPQKRLEIKRVENGYQGQHRHKEEIYLTLFPKLVDFIEHPKLNVSPSKLQLNFPKIKLSCNNGPIVKEQC